MSNRKPTLLTRCTLARSIFAAMFALAANNAMATHVIFADEYPYKKSSASPSHVEYSSCAHALDQDRLEALGHTMSVFPPTDDGWAAALAGAYGEGVIVVGECQEYFEISPETQGAISSYVNSGKKIVVIGDHYGSVEFINPTFGYSANVVYGCKSGEDLAGTLTVAAAGTTFQNDPGELINLSCTSGLETASLPSGAKTFYAGESEYYGGGERTAARIGNANPSDISTYPTSLVWANAYGSGTVAWLGYDFACWGCGPDGAYDDDWYIVLDSALRYTAYTGSANLRLGFSGPTTPVRANSPATIYARLDNYGRDTAQNPVVNINVGWPVSTASVSATGWTCTGGGMDNKTTQSSPPPAALQFQCRADSGLMPRGSLVFKVQLTTPTTTPGGFVSISGDAGSDSTDPVPSNNTASFKLYVRSAPTISPVLPPVN